MVGFSEALGNIVQGAFCSFIQEGEEFYNWIGNGLGGVDLPGEGVYRNLYRQVCDREPPPPPPVRFPPGQCEAPYSWVSNFELYLPPPSDFSIPGSRFGVCGTSGEIYGPITGPFRRPVGGSFAYAISGFDGAGNVKVLDITSEETPPANEIRNVTINFTRCSGDPDACGVPTYEQPPPDYRERDEPLEYTNNEGDTINLPLNLTFGFPIININNEVNVPVSINIQEPSLGLEFEIQGNFELNGPEFTFNFGGGNGGDPRGGPCNETPTDSEPTSPLPPAPPGSIPEPPPDAPPESVDIIRAVVVTVTNDQSGASIVFGADDSPDLYVPDLGVVWFLCRFGASGLAWCGGIRVQALRQLIPCPWEGGAVDYSFSPRPGVLATVTPIRRRFDAPIQFN